MSDYSRNAWKYYEYGRAYNNSLRPNQYRLVETNTEFFAGNQWINMPDNEAMRRLSKPTFNIIKRVTSMFVANLTSGGTTINFEPLAGQADGAVAGLTGRNISGETASDAASFATAEVRNLLEKFKMDFRIRDALFDGAITGDYCAHFFWNPEARPYGGAFGEYKGEIEMELIDGINVMFGNPNIHLAEKQPYIIIVGRDTVESLKREAEYWAEKRAREAELAQAEAVRAGTAGAGAAVTGTVREASFGADADALNGAGAASGMTAESFNAGVSGDDGIGPMRELEAMRREQRAGGIINNGGGLQAGGIGTDFPRGSVFNFGVNGKPKLYGVDGADGKLKLDGAVAADSDWGTAPGAGQRIEIHGDDDKSSKATYIYMYTKEKRTEAFIDENGTLVEREVSTVHVTKATRSCTIFEDIDTGLTRYPVAWGNWQHQKNQYHGRALVTEVIPNQIFINQMMAMVFRHLQTQAFPTKVFNADLLPGISNEVGTAIGVRNLLPGQTLSSVVSTLPAADMSNQIIQAIELCMQYTKECLGATDAQLGSLDATNTSALMVLQSASEVPLENTRAGLNEWVEDIGAILLDMMGTYYGLRPIQRTIDIEEPVLGADGQQLIDPMTGQPAVNRYSRTVLQDYDFSKFKRLWFNISVDVGATTYYSEIAMVQTLDNLRREGTLDTLDYLERIPDKLISKKQDLIEKIKKKEGVIDVTDGTAGAAALGTNPVAAMAMGVGQAGAGTGADLSGTQAAGGKAPGGKTSGENASGEGTGKGGSGSGSSGKQSGGTRSGASAHTKQGGGTTTGASAHTMGSELDAAKKVQLLPSRLQNQYESLPTIAQHALLKL